MISGVTSTLKRVFQDDSTVRLDSEILLENNMNMLIDGITVSSSISDTEYTDAMSYEVENTDGLLTLISWPTGKPNPFKKIFPVDSVAKPFRPSSSGINYLLTGEIFPKLYPPQIQIYPETSPRVYYPGIKTTYKYWLGPQGLDIDLTLRYLQTAESWAQAKTSGVIPKTSGDLPVGNKAALANKITVKFDVFHSVPLSYTITVTDASDAVKTFTKEISELEAVDWNGVAEIFWNGTAWSLTDPFMSQIQTNYATPYKIKSIKLEAVIGEIDKRIAVIELSSSWVKNIKSSIIDSFSISKESSGGGSDLLPVGFVNSNSLNINMVDYNQDFIKIKEYNRDLDWDYAFNDIFYVAKNSKFTPYSYTFYSGGYHGVSPDKYDKTIQGIFYADNWSIDEFGYSSISCLDSAKYLMETLCPDLLLENYPVTSIFRVLLDSVGFTSYKFNIKETVSVVDGVSITSPDKSIPSVNYWWTTDTNTVWQAIQELCRDIQMNAFFDEYGTLQFSSREYLYGKTDGDWTFRYAPESYIDNVTNPSAPVTKTKLPNISSFAKKEIASANQVKVLWKTPISSNYLGNSTYLWQSSVTFLAAGGLKYPIPNPTATVTSVTKTGGIVTFNAPNSFLVNNVVSITGASPSQFNLSNAVITEATSSYFKVAASITGTYTSGGVATITPESTALIVDINSIDNYSQYNSTFNFQGYFLVDSEIIEYDAIQYQYVPMLKADGSVNNDNSIIKVWIESESDISKYRYLSKNGYDDPSKPQSAYFRPTGRYRIKERGTLGTLAKAHNATSDSPAEKWSYAEVSWSI